MTAARTTPFQSALGRIYEHDLAREPGEAAAKFRTNAGAEAVLILRGAKSSFRWTADLQHDPEEIPRFLEKIEEGYDLVSGGATSGGITG